MAVALLVVQPALAAELVANPNEVMEVLRQLFPRCTVSASGEPIYRVSGPLLDDAEKCASAGHDSHMRRVRAEVFRFVDWTGRTEYLAVLQYAFEMDVPPEACPSIARIATLRRRRAGGWEITSSYVPELRGHRSLDSVRVLDLNADGFDELAVESDWGVPGLTESVMLVFDLSSGRLKELAAIPTRIDRTSRNAERLRQVLDLASSQHERGLKFCFVKTVYEWQGHAFRPPRVTHPCYAAGQGLAPAH